MKKTSVHERTKCCYVRIVAGLCERCREREGTANQEGLIAKEVKDAVAIVGKTFDYFTCPDCNSAWTLVQEIGTGRPARFIRDILLDD